MKHIPNIITFMRILCLPLLVANILAGNYAGALFCAIFMGASDAVDGFLAKNFGWCSQLGEQLDPLADKLMLVSAFIALWWVGLLPAWFVIVAAARDVALVAGAAFRRFRWGHLSVRPIMLSKISTFAQILLVFSVLAAQLLPGVLIVVQPLIFISAATAVVSAVKYFQDFFALLQSGHYRSRFAHGSTKPEILK